MSANRADFVSLLFTRNRPAGLTIRATAKELMAAYLQSPADDETLFNANLKAVTDHLTKTRSLPISAEDLAGIEYVYRNFHKFGPDIQYTSSINGSGRASYATLMATNDDVTLEERSYLANEDNFAFVKAMQQKNLIVPLVGDFAGPKALRSVGMYLRDRGAIISAFYLSNVEMYLEQNGAWERFCANVATMPLNAESTFIRTGGVRSIFGKFGSMTAEASRCAIR